MQLLFGAVQIAPQHKVFRARHMYAENITGQSVQLCQLIPQGRVFRAALAVIDQQFLGFVGSPGALQNIGQRHRQWVIARIQIQVFAQ